MRTPEWKGWGIKYRGDCLACGAKIFSRKVGQKFCGSACWYVHKNKEYQASGVKGCGFCKRELPFTEFVKMPNGAFSAYCHECRTARARMYYERSGGKKNAKKRPTEADPKKRLARSLFQSAVRRGKIKRQPCEICGDKAQGHHEDYSKPYDVKWLCRKHHGIEHRKKLSPEVEKAYALKSAQTTTTTGRE